MKRFIDTELELWKRAAYRKPLLLRGARQVGKTYAVEQFGKTFLSFVEINCEAQLFRPNENIKNLFVAMNLTIEYCADTFDLRS